MQWRNLVPQRLINVGKHLPYAILATIFYRYPARKLVVIGVTGTDGKTTTSTLIYEILKKAGYKVALISTVAAKIGNQELETGLHVTTPNSWELQRLLRVIVDKGFTHLVLEATSHGFDQYRLWGCNFKVGVVTNVTRDHLDYHKSYQHYLESKGKLFRMTAISVLNKDDKSFAYLRKLTRGRVVTYGMDNADITPQNFSFKTTLIGEYNTLNCLAAIAVGRSLGIVDHTIRQAIAGFEGVKGRMEEISLGQKFRVFVDFAHTPNGLKNALMTLKKLPHKKLIAVFGCAGLRDKGKRPMMGEIACQLTDMVVLTAEDPRTEEVTKIIDKIVSGCLIKKKVHREPDRQKAINLAIVELAHPGDIVGIFGKGHEQSMCFGHTEYPWSDYKAAKEAINWRLKK